MSGRLIINGFLQFKKKDRLYVVHDFEYYKWRMGEFMDFQQPGMFFQIKNECFAAIRIALKSGFIVDFYPLNQNLS